MTTTEGVSRQSRLEMSVQPGRLFINGRWVDGQARLSVVDPATGKDITSAVDASVAEVSTAVAAARDAFDSGVWSSLPARQRGRVLIGAAHLLRERADEFAYMESVDTGKPFVMTKMGDVVGAAETLEYYGMLAASIEGSVRDTAMPLLAYTRREPVGVVGAITPFNFPLILSIAKIAPALAAGNTLVHKPSEETPLTALKMGELLHEAGIPAGAFNVVTGGAEAGRALAEDLRVNKVAFTGSTAVGRRIAAAAGANMQRVTMELGGKSANLIFADADLDAAIAAAISGFVFNTGQFCMAGSRLLVQRSVFEQVVDAVAKGASAVKVGNPFDESTVIGPVTGVRQYQRVRSYIERARVAGVRILGPGAVDAEFPEGFYILPTVLAEVDQDSVFVQEEIFGPIVTMQPFDDEDEAITLANGTAYGLAAGVQTTDIRRAHRVATRLEAGVVWVNGWGLLDPAVPMGGYKASGFGRENGPEGLDEYLQTKSVVIGL